MLFGFFKHSKATPRKPQFHGSFRPRGFRVKGLFGGGLFLRFQFSIICLGEPVCYKQAYPSWKPPIILNTESSSCYCIPDSKHSHESPPKPWGLELGVQR